MEPGDLLSTLVEFSVAVAGFTGVVAALGPTRPATWPALQRGFFAALLGSAAISAGVSILGLVLLAAPVSEAAAWGFTSAAHSAGLIGVVSIRVREMRSAHLARNPISIPILLGVASLLLVQAANALLLQRAWVCVAALGAYAFLSLLYFVVLVRALWGDSSANPPAA